MKNKYIFLILFFLAVSCAPSFYENKPSKQLGEFDKFFQNKRTILGRPTVELISANPVGITLIYQSVWVSGSEVARAAEYHCRKFNKSALEKSSTEVRSVDIRIVYECK